MIIEKEYCIPISVDAAIEKAEASKGHFKYLAGGTDVMVNRYQGNENAPCLIDITNIPELKGITITDEALQIGALETLEDIGQSHIVLNEFPMLAEAALSVGAPLLRKSATIGGNILCENRCYFYNQSEWWREAAGHCLKCNGDVCIATGGKKACFSEMVSDTAPALIAMDATIVVADVNREKKVKLEEIYTGDGVNPINLTETAIVKSICLPRHRNFQTDFQKLRERESLEFTSLTSAVAKDDKGKIKIALSGVDPKPVVVEGSQDSDPETLIKKAVKGARSVDNDMYSRKYRREMIQVFLQKSFEVLK